MALRDYLDVDIEKPVSTFVDLTNYFQARVGDVRPYVKLHIKSGSQSVDMSTKKITFSGRDANGTPFIDAGGMEDDEGQDDRQIGLITFHFPEGIFQVEGKWQVAYFNIETQNGEKISTINLTLNVLPNSVAMGISIHPFLPEIETVRSQVNKALSELNAQQLLNQIDSMKSTVGAYTDLISKNQVLNKPDTEKLIGDKVDSFKQSLTSQIDSIKNNVNSQVNNLSSSLNKQAWHSEQYGGTMLNGATGWVMGVVNYNSVACVGSICGWVKFGKDGHTKDFATNPLYGKVKFDNTKGVAVNVDGVNSDDSYRGTCNVDQSNKALGLWAKTYPTKNEEYTFLFNMIFTGSHDCLA